MTVPHDGLTSGDSREPVMVGGMSPLTCVIPGFLLVVMVAVAGGLLFINCLRATDATSYATRVDALPEDEPVFLSGPGIFLVRTQNSVLALANRDARHDDTGRSCVIRWREALEHENHRGFFRSDCTGALYDLNGAPVARDGPPMSRHLVIHNGERVTIDYTRCISPGEGNPLIDCKP